VAASSELNASGAVGGGSYGLRLAYGLHSFSSLYSLAQAQRVRVALSLPPFGLPPLGQPDAARHEQAKRSL